jgi:hypothetical protein
METIPTTCKCEELRYNPIQLLGYEVPRLHQQELGSQIRIFYDRNTMLAS